MEENRQLIDLLDDYLKGRLNLDDLNAFEKRMNEDPEFRKSVEDYKMLIQSIHKVEANNQLKRNLDQVHQQIEITAIPVEKSEMTVVKPMVNNRWKMLRVAATVALFTIAGTWLVMRSFNEVETAQYRELRRKVDQISKSQTVILNDIAKANKQEEPVSARYTGTGFLISSNGYVATSYHLIRGADSVLIHNEKFGSLKTTVLRTDQINDVAILKIEDPSFKTSVPYQINATQADLGQDVFTLGFPREEIVYGEGTISASTGYKQNITAYQIAVPVNPGNSGGPLLDQQGNVVGMISGIETETQGAAFAVKSQILLEVVKNISSDSLGNEIQLPRSNKLKSLSRVQQVKKIRDYVFVVKVYGQQ